MATAATMPRGAKTAMAAMSLPEAAGSDVASTSRDNPSLTPAKEEAERFGVTQEDQDKLVETITTLRGGWGPNRLRLIPQWMKNALMYRGSQVLAWDANTGNWFDAVAAWQETGNEEGESDVYDERFICNITQSFGMGFKGIMSRGIPQTVVRPENAEILADVATAKAAQEAVGIVERKNKNRQMLRKESETLYQFGTYFKHTRGVLDAIFAGSDEEEVYGEVPVTRPDRFHCFGCGKDTPWAPKADASAQRQCASCGKGLGPETFYPGSTQMEMSVVGTKKVPRAMVKQTIHSPLEVDVDPLANDLNGTPLLALDQEIDLGEARMMYPAMAEEIREGMEVGTTPNSSYERLRRTELASQGNGYMGDTGARRPTYSQNWMQPQSFYELGDMEFAQRMVQRFPEGLKLTLLGTTVVDIRAAVLAREWTTCRLHENFGLYSPAVADNVVNFNDRLNDGMQKIDEWVADSANGLNVIDGSRLDKEAFNGKPLSSAVLNEIPMKIHGEYRPLGEAFAHFDLPMEAQVFSYPEMLMQFCQLIACLPPQATGAGTLPGVETKGGQEQMLSQASNVLNLYWENIKEEHAMAALNIVYWLKKMMKAGALMEISEAIEDKGSTYRNNYVNLSKMNGEVNVFADVDQGLPMSPEAVREVFQEIFKEAGAGNAEAQAIMDIVANSEQMMQSLGTPDLVVPRQAQQQRTQQHINVLLEQDYRQTPGPNGQVQMTLPVTPNKNVDDFVLLKQIVRLFRQENGDIEQSNPPGWARLDAYVEMAKQMELQDAVEDATRKQQVSAASAPPPPQPDATVGQAKKDLLNHAVPMVDRLAAIAMTPPLPKGSSLTAQVSSAKEVVDAAIKAAA